MLYDNALAQLLTPTTYHVALAFFSCLTASFLVPLVKKYLPDDTNALTTACQAGAALAIFYWIHTPVWPFPYFLLGLIGYSFTLFFIGSSLPKPMLRYFSYGLFIIASLRLIQVYDRVMTPELFLQMNSIYAFFSFGLFFAYFIRKKYAQHFYLAETDFLISMLAPIGTLFNTMWWRDWIASYFVAGSSAQWSALAGLHLCYGLFVVGFGYYFRSILLRYLGIIIALASCYYLVLLMRAS